jgi:hypothetical protein
VRNSYRASLTSGECDKKTTYSNTPEDESLKPYIKLLDKVTKKIEKWHLETQIKT